MQRRLDQLPESQRRQGRRRSQISQFPGRRAHSEDLRGESAYGGLRIDSGTLSANGSIDVSVNVNNVGSRDGEEVVQLYTRLPNSKVPRPRRSLQGFQRVAIRAGETKRVSFELAAKQPAELHEGLL